MLYNLISLFLGLSFPEPPPPQLLRNAIQDLAPRKVGPRTRAMYTRIIYRAALQHRNIDAFLAIAFIHTESNWNPKLRSPTNDYGLMQVHVAARGSARFLGRETELYKPATNIREWFRLATMWQNYHKRTCVNAKHGWWVHLKWGKYVRSTRLEKVEAVYRKLLSRYRTRTAYPDV